MVTARRPPTGLDGPDTTAARPHPGRRFIGITRNKNRACAGPPRPLRPGRCGCPTRLTVASVAARTSLPAGAGPGYSGPEMSRPDDREGQPHEIGPRTLPMLVTQLLSALALRPLVDAALRAVEA